MIIINKKRILTITMCLIVTFFIAGVTKRKETVETVALPVENKVIIIDARTWCSRFSAHQVMKE